MQKAVFLDANSGDSTLMDRVTRTATSFCKVWMCSEMTPFSAVSLSIHRCKTFEHACLGIRHISLFSKLQDLVLDLLNTNLRKPDVQK